MDQEAINRIPKYIATHIWLRYHYGKANHCSNDKTHQSKKFEWANISGEYRRDVNDYKQLCPSCHRKMDYTEHQRALAITMKRKSKNAQYTKIQQYLGDKLINEYNSFPEAAKATNILKTGIQNNVAGRSRSAGGYTWRYI